MKTYLNRLQKNDAIFDEVRYPTGFPELDKALSGGLVAGLHCIGAISSLGKTTFVLQMAENMASTGIPVIIFSLEMRPEQLVAKTVSKNMYLAALERVDSQNIDIYHHAKGYSDLMCERNRKAFTAKERILYENSIKETKSATSKILIVSETADGKPFCIDEIMDFINTYIFDKHANLKYKFGNRHFWAEGYYVSTVGLNEETIKKYNREQATSDIALDKLSVKEYEDPFRGSK